MHVSFAVKSAHFGTVEGYGSDVDSCGEKNGTGYLNDSFVDYAAFKYRRV